MSLSHMQVEQPTGSRRLTLPMLSARDQADGFEGLPAGTAKPLRYLAAFQEAEPYLGLPPQAYKLVAWLVRQTMPHDWETGSRPICWPSAARQKEFLGLSSPARVKILNRILFEAGIFVIRDSETGKRYGRRGPDKRIVEAYGFDLSPLAVRYEEFIRIAAEARREREIMRGLKKRATCARRAIRAAGETLAGLGPLPSGWSQLEAETGQLVAEIRHCSRSGDLGLIVNGLESRKTEVENWLREASISVNKSPEGPVERPDSISTTYSNNLIDTVIARQENSGGGKRGASHPAISRSGENEEGILAPSVDFKPFERVEKLHPGELLQLAPRLKEVIPERYPGWPEIVHAAGTYLRHDLRISQQLWGDACQAMGRQLATVVLAVVSTKPQEHFTRGAGGYFAAMVKRHQKGELHLDRSLWKLRRDSWSVKPPVSSKSQSRH